MSQFEAWFTEGACYVLPDDTPIIARYCEIGQQQRWWLVTADDKRIVAAVYPNGSVWNYQPWPSEDYPSVFLPQRSDLSIEDLRPAEPGSALPHWLARTGNLLAFAWIVDGIGDIIGVASTLTL
jgi:hypothetical protein